MKHPIWYLLFWVILAGIVVVKSPTGAGGKSGLQQTGDLINGFSGDATSLVHALQGS